MTRTAMAIVGQEADARDAVQEALAAIWRALPSLREPDRFEAWSTRILVHASRRIAARRGRRSVRELVIPPDAVDGGDARSSAGSHPSADDLVVRHDTLERAFDRLAPDARAILALHHLDGRPLTEIAAILGVPTGTVKSRLHAARSALDRALDREDR